MDARSSTCSANGSSWHETSRQVLPITRCAPEPRSLCHAVMLPVNAVGERLEGKPHEPFDGGAEETRWSRPVARLRSTLHRMPGLTGGRWRSSSHGEPESMHLPGNRRD